jgi:hypothetical protein
LWFGEVGSGKWVSERGPNHHIQCFPGEVPWDPSVSDLFSPLISLCSKCFHLCGHVAIESLHDLYHLDCLGRFVAGNDYRITIGDRDSEGAGLRGCGRIGPRAPLTKETHKTP